MIEIFDVCFSWAEKDLGIKSSCSTAMAREVNNNRCIRGRFLCQASKLRGHVVEFGVCAGEQANLLFDVTAARWIGENFTHFGRITYGCRQTSEARADVISNAYNERITLLEDRHNTLSRLK